MGEEGRSSRLTDTQDALPASAKTGEATAAGRPSSVPWTPQLVRIMAGLMLCIFVAAMDSTVVGTALPTISRELNGFALYSWVFTGYLLTGTTSVPIWGRLADLYGRRRVLLTGLALFVVASLLCGASTNMLALVIFRTLQGVGAGCLQPVTFTVVGDIFPLQQRARLQGFFSGMWALAAIIGPLLGALFVSTIGWRWIFVINLPVGVVAAALLWGYHEKSEQRAGGGLDLPGATALTVGVALLLWGLGAGNAAAEPVPMALLAAVAILAAFVVIEVRSAGPTIPLSLLRRPSVGPPLLVALLAGTVMFGSTAYVPLFVQGVLGGSTYQAGAAIAPMSLGWPVASVISGRVLLRVGFRWVVAVGGVLLALGALMLAARPPGAGVVWVGLSSAVIGAGLGAISTPILIVIQSSVPWDQRGSATALNQFSRTIGGAIGVAGLGILMLARLRGEASGLGLPPSATANPLHPAAGAASRILLAAGLDPVFWVLVGLAAATLAATLVIVLRGRGVDSDLR